MNYDVRTPVFLFKHSTDMLPDPLQENYKEHFHNGFELFLFLQGEADFVVQEASFSLKPRDLIIVKPGNMHNIRVNPNKLYERVVIRFYPSDIDPMIVSRLMEVPTALNIKDSRIAEEFRRLDTYGQELKGPFLIQAFSGELIILLSFLCMSKELNVTKGSVNPFLAKILSYIDSNAPRIRSASEIASLFSRSESSIQKLFYSQLKTPVMSYVRTRRCMLAKTLLDSGEPAKVVYRRCGYSTYSTFYRAYQRTYGCPPSAVLDSQR